MNHMAGPLVFFGFFLLSGIAIHVARNMKVREERRLRLVKSHHFEGSDGLGLAQKKEMSAILKARAAA